MSGHDSPATRRVALDDNREIASVILSPNLSQEERLNRKERKGSQGVIQAAVFTRGRVTTRVTNPCRSSCPLRLCGSNSRV